MLKQKEADGAYMDRALERANRAEAGARLASGQSTKKRSAESGIGRG